MFYAFFDYICKVCPSSILTKISELKTKLTLFVILVIFLTSSALAEVVQNRLSFTDGTHLLDEMIQKKKSISSILNAVDSLDKKDFVTTQAYADFLIYAEGVLKSNHERELIGLTFKMSEFFQEHNMHQNAFIYLNRTLTMIELYPRQSAGISRSKLFEDMGISYYNFKRMNLAKKWLFKAIQEKDIQPVSEINVYNTIAMIHRNQQQEDSSKFYFEKALLLAKKYQKKEWIGIISGNLGYHYLIRKDYLNGRKLVRKDLEISHETKQWTSALLAQCILAEIDIIEKQTENAREGIERASLLLEKSPTLEGKYYYYKVNTKYLEHISDFEGALKSYKRIVAYKDTIDQKLNLENFSNIEFQLNFEKKQAEIGFLREKKKQNELIIIILFISIVSVSISFTVIFFQYRKRKTREEEILNVEKLRMAQELKSTDEQMRKVLKDLINKNQLVENLSEEIEQIKLSDTDSKLKIETAKLSEKLQSFVLLTEENWMDFKKLFEKLNPGFFEHFSTQYPDLTNAEVRLAALIKLNLSNSEMAHTLGISPNSVRKTNLRLRKRLNIEEQVDLMKLIMEI